jgi:hypothetical protein
LACCFGRESCKVHSTPLHTDGLLLGSHGTELVLLASSIDDACIPNPAHVRLSYRTGKCLGFVSSITRLVSNIFFLKQGESPTPTSDEMGVIHYHAKKTKRAAFAL